MIKLHHILTRVILSTSLLLFAATALTWPGGDHATAAHPPALNRDFSYGIRAELTGVDTDLILSGVNAMKVNWVAQSINWASIEPVQGQYNWAELDTVVDAVQAYPVQLMLTVAGAPDWARPAGADLTRPGPPEDLALFAGFMGQVAARYQGKIGAYEIWPGANDARAWSSPAGLSALSYVALLSRSRDAIRANDPLAIVVSGALTPAAPGDGITLINDLTFLTDMYTAGLATSVSAVGAQLTPHNNPPSDAPGLLSGVASGYTEHSYHFFRHYENIYRVMVNAGDPDRSLWITAAGWASTPTPLTDAPWASTISEETQSAYLLAGLEQISHQPYVAVLFVDNFNFAVAGGSDTSAARSLIRADWSARPAFVALASALQQNQPTEEAPLVALPEPVYLLPNWDARVINGEP